MGGNKKPLRSPVRPRHRLGQESRHPHGCGTMIAQHASILPKGGRGGGGVGPLPVPAPAPPPRPPENTPPQGGLLVATGSPGRTSSAFRYSSSAFPYFFFANQALPMFNRAWKNSLFFPSAR